MSQLQWIAVIASRLNSRVVRTPAWKSVLYFAAALVVCLLYYVLMQRQPTNLD